MGLWNEIELPKTAAAQEFVIIFKIFSFGGCNLSQVRARQAKFGGAKL